MSAARALGRGVRPVLAHHPSNLFNSVSTTQLYTRRFCLSAPSEVSIDGAATAPVAPESTSAYSSTTPSSTAVSIPSPSYRRVSHSSVLPLEAVALSPSLTSAIHALLRQVSCPPSHFRSAVSRVISLRSPDTYREKPSKAIGMSFVRPLPKYTADEAAAYTAVRFPATYAANVYAMVEALRNLPHFNPRSVLDFGAGPATASLAALRVFSPTPDTPPILTSQEILDEVIGHFTLVDQAPAMRSIADKLLRASPTSHDLCSVKIAESLFHKSVKTQKHSLVCASFSLSEVVREAISEPVLSQDEGDVMNEKGGIDRNDRVKLADRRLRKTLKTLWQCTKPGGLLVVVEDGTAAGFETVSFARDYLLNFSTQVAGQGEEKAMGEARVIAPCLHSQRCPLSDSITRHRICRFEQRLNRPLFTRTLKKMSTGYEDEYFSYLVVQKLKGKAGNEELPDGWGRLIRRPLLKGKHVALDACTKDAQLERRVISKRRKAVDFYSKARRAKWGDIWPKEPSTKSRPLNF